MYPFLTENYRPMEIEISFLSLLFSHARVALKDSESDVISS